MKRAVLIGVAAMAAVLLVMISLNRKSSQTSEADRNRAFSASMSGVTLVGHSTQLHHDGLSGEERYTLDKVSHVAGDTWLFQTRMKFEGHDLPLPLPITVKWAGDTPVITLTDFSIPGLGTYTARVVLYRDQYAGTWSGGNHGGQLFGQIVPGAPH